MADIVSVEWDFGDGKRSSRMAPTNKYTPGVYDVTAYITDSLGVVTEIKKQLYINVAEVDGSLTSADYLSFPRCLHFGWKDEHGYGWSLNSGMFAWPQTPASVSEYESNGQMYTLVWDLLDGYEYHINTINTHKEKAEYKDREIHPIETKIRTSEFTGEMKRYDLSHVETNIKIKPDILMNGFTDGFEFNVGLITDTGNAPVEVRMKVDTDKEIVFFYQNKQVQGHTTQRQLEFTTTESNYQLLTYESFFKSNDRQKRHDINASQVSMATPVIWYTRGQGYNYNRVTGETIVNTATDYVGLAPDNIAGISTASTVVDFSLANDSGMGMCLWAKDGLSSNSTITFLPYGEYINDFKLYYYNGVLPIDLQITGTVFDVRVFSATIPEEVLAEYRRDFLQYLPRA